MKVEFIDRHKAEHGVQPICDTLKDTERRDRAEHLLRHQVAPGIGPTVGWDGRRSAGR